MCVYDKSKIIQITGLTQIIGKNLTDYSMDGYSSTRGKMHP